MPVRLHVVPLLEILLVIATCVYAADVLPPAEAAKKVGEECTVEMMVKASKNALEKRMFVYLDSEESFKDPKNFAVVITKNAADKMKNDGIDDPAVHFKDKLINATGKVEIDDEHKILRIIIDDPKLIKIVAGK